MYRLAAWGYLNLISSATEYDVLDRIEGRIDYLFDSYLHQTGYQQSNDRNLKLECSSKCPAWPYKKWIITILFTQKSMAQ